MSWDQYFINLCYEIAKKSKDPSTKVGCVLVYPDNGICSTGFNGFARGVKEVGDGDGFKKIVDPECLSHTRAKERWEDRSLKYPLVCHSEFNAVLNAARHGHITQGCKIYVPWHPCSVCANAIVQAGVVEVIMDGDFEEDPELMKRWAKEHELAALIFREGGVLVRKHN